MKKCLLFIISLTIIFDALCLIAGESRGRVVNMQYYNFRIPAKNSLIAVKNGHKNCWNIFRFKEIIYIEPVTFFMNNEGNIVSEPIPSEKIADSKAHKTLSVLTDFYPINYKELKEVHKNVNKITASNFIFNVICDIDILTDESHVLLEKQRGKGADLEKEESAD